MFFCWNIVIFTCWRGNESYDQALEVTTNADGLSAFLEQALLIPRLTQDNFSNVAESFLLPYIALNLFFATGVLCEQEYDVCCEDSGQGSINKGACNIDDIRMVRGTGSR